MGNRFYISDTHFGHAGTWERFKNADGTPLRPFTSTEEMDEKMIENWNSVVKEHDTVYHAGDAVIGKKHLEKFRRLNGKKKLIMGNHDIFKVPAYNDVGFYDTVAYRVFVDEFVVSHMPIHMASVSDRFIANVHGHLHGNRVMKIKHVQGHDIIYSDTEIDPRYFSICVEQINYTPISHEDLKAAIQKQFDDCGYKRPTKKGFGNGSAD